MTYFALFNPVTSINNVNVRYYIVTVSDMGGTSDTGQNRRQADVEGRNQESDRQHSPGENLPRRVLLQRVGTYIYICLLHWSILPHILAYQSHAGEHAIKGQLTPNFKVEKIPYYDRVISNNYIYHNIYLLSPLDPFGITSACLYGKATEYFSNV